VKREQEDLFGKGKLVVAIAREKIITFQAHPKIGDRVEHCLHGMHGFVHLQVNDRHRFDKTNQQRIIAVAARS